MAEAAAPRLLVERFTTAAAGLLRQETLAQELATAQRPLLLVWHAPRALILGHSDVQLAGFSAATAALEAAGWPVLVRRSGGTACPISSGTLQLALTRVAEPEASMEAGYAELAGLIIAVLARLGLKAEVGERPEAFCPGRWDLSLAGRKVAGLSQHWRRSGGLPTVTTAASLIVEADPTTLTNCIEHFYRSAGAPRPCSAAAVGSLAQALPATAAAREQLVLALRQNLLVAPLAVHQQ